MDLQRRRFRDQQMAGILKQQEAGRGIAELFRGRGVDELTLRG
jgi:hypothetical protein